MSESQWVRKRRDLVENIVQGRTMVAAAKEDKELSRDTMLAMRDEIKDLRAENETLKTEKEALAEEVVRLEELLNPTR
jgi:hypothetical protein